MRCSTPQMNRSSMDGDDLAGMTRESWEASKNVSIHMHPRELIGYLANNEPQVLEVCSCSFI